MNGCTPAIIRTCPIGAIERMPLTGLNAQSNTFRCSSCSCGAPSMVSFSSMYSTMSLTSLLSYPSLRRAAGTVPLTIFRRPPPTSFLYLTRARSGSIPVVSQSIISPIVPVGASTVAWALR